METEATGAKFHQQIESQLLEISGKLPNEMKFPLKNSLLNFERSLALIEIDREMASFRAINGQEEAASCLIIALISKMYFDAEKLDPRNHVHKNAIIAFLIAIGPQFHPFLKRFFLEFDTKRGRIEAKFPLSNFGVKNGDEVWMQPVEPLDISVQMEGYPVERAFDNAINQLSTNSGSANIQRLIRTQANQRNLLLYASTSGLPKSRADRKTIIERRNLAFATLIVSIMIFQAEAHLLLVKQSVPAILSIIGKARTD